MTLHQRQPMAAYDMDRLRSTVQEMEEEKEGGEAVASESLSVTFNLEVGGIIIKLMDLG